MTRGPTETQILLEDHGVIGDLRTVALVGLNGSIPFLCAPDFDGPSIFASLLDESAGHFKVFPQQDGLRTTQMYLPDTNVLLTRFMSEQGIAELTDFMPVSGLPGPQRIIRRLATIRGKMTFDVVCAPRFDYARVEHELECRDGGGVFRPARDDLPVLTLRTSSPLQARDGDLVGAITLRAGEACDLELVIGDLGSQADASDAGVAAAFDATVRWWRGWTGGTQYQGRWREMVTRSALMLKLLTSARHGAMVAAATFGLPEELGGGRNWDYRYCWIRDTSFAMYAYVRLGLVEEAERFLDWIGERVRDCAASGSADPLRIMYALDGRTELAEQTLDHFAGYAGSRPVRVGNGAADQFQLDIYGELMDAVYLANKYGRSTSWQGWQDVCTMVDWVRANWRRPDRGIWEGRGESKHFLHSRLMCWVALDRAIRLAQKRSLPAALPDWNQARLEIHASIHAEFWSEELDSFVQFPGAATPDGSMLLMPLVRFISPRDPRWLGTMKLIEKHLVEDALVFRRAKADRPLDGLDGTEGSFLACSFWYVEALARAGENDRARLLFEKLLGYGNHVGLFAEEISAAGRQLGNFPQVLTHLALISAASYLDRVLSGRQREPWT